jgi:aminomethyltransferase
MSQLRRTPLSDWHAAHGGRLVEFAGWSMPIQYAGVLAEHQAVRTACGLFDVSHMAELRVRGNSARAALDALLTNDLSQLAPSAAVYTALCREDGGILDDLLVYCLAETDWLVVANASNREKVATWLAARLTGATLEDQTESTALLALQGPRSLDILCRLQRLGPHAARLGDLAYYHAMQCDAGGMRILLSRTGYTGERGFELYVAWQDALTLWEELLQAGAPLGLVPCGLGARDTLRLEAGFSLYGHELSEDCSPWEAGIGWVVRLKKRSDFVGRSALATQKERGVARNTLPLLLPGRNIARQGATVLAGDRSVGIVTSGSFSPTLERGIALARVESTIGDAALSLDIRGRVVAAERTKLPFVPNRTRD